MVSALPPEYTSRFGEICWAQGGVGWGWWPCCIYDPRLTAPRTRSHAKKHLGKKHLVYFFQCDETPFDILAPEKIKTWEEGMAEGLHMGRTAKSCGKKRFLQFQEALQAAVIEDGKPICQRLEWQQDETCQFQQPRFLPSPVPIRRRTAPAPRRSKPKRTFFKQGRGKKRPRNGSTDTASDDGADEMPVVGSPMSGHLSPKRVRAHRTLDFSGGEDASNGGEVPTNRGDDATGRGESSSTSTDSRAPDSYPGNPTEEDGDAVSRTESSAAEQLGDPQQKDDIISAGHRGGGIEVGFVEDVC